jgi:outer membrane receptor protein involved in Fe transport
MPSCFQEQRHHVAEPLASSPVPRASGSAAFIRQTSASGKFIGQSYSHSATAGLYPQTTMNTQYLTGIGSAASAADSTSTADHLASPRFHSAGRGKWLRASLGLCLPVLMGLKAEAQTTTPAEPVKAKEEVIELSPFTVNVDQDKGYKTTNSVAGTRLNTAIKDVPMSIEVITNEFMRDTGATSLRESLRYSSGITLSSQQDGLVDPGSLDTRSNAGANDPRGVDRDPNGTTLKIRGFVIDQVLRDGFRRQSSSDAINIERVEVVRGPSALLYGVGNFGGVVNYLPKEPKLKPAYSLESGIGNWGYKRGALDFTGPLGASDNRWQAAYRLTAAVQETGDGTEYFKQKSRLVSPVFSFRPFANTYVKFDSEFGSTDQTGVGFQNVRSRAGGSGAQQRRSNFVTTVLGAGIDARTFRWSGPDTYSDAPLRNYALTLEQKITDDLIFRVGAQTGHTERESLNIFSATVIAGATTFNGTRPTDAFRLALLGSPVPLPVSIAGDDMAVDRDGQSATTLNGILRYQWSNYFENEDRDQLRAELAYHLKKFGNHQFLLGYQYQNRNREWWDFSPVATGDARDRFNFHNPMDFTPFQFGTQGDGMPDVPLVANRWDKGSTWDSGFYGIYQGRLLKDRVTFIGGARHDRSDQRNYSRNYQGNGLLVVTDRSASRPDAPSATSLQYGLNIAITRQISLYGLHSEALVPQYFVRDGLGRPFDPTKAKNNELGAKFDLLEGRVSGTVGVFKIQRFGTPRNIWWAPAPAVGVQYNPNLPRAYRVGGAPSSPAFIAAYQNEAWWQQTVGTRNLTTTQVLINTDTTAGTQFMRAAFDWAQKHPGDFPAAFMFSGNGTASTFADGTAGIVNTPGVNAGANVQIDDQATGWDTQWIISPTDNWQIVLNYANTLTKVTSGYNYVKAPIDDEFAMWKFPWVSWGTVVGIPASEAFTDPTDSSTYKGIGSGKGQSLDDTPRHTVSLWTKYAFTGTRLKGWAVGGGGQYMSERPYVTGFTIDGTAINTTDAQGKPQPLKLLTSVQYTFSGMVEYTRQFGKYETRFALNVNNILDDKKIYGYLYAPGRSYRFTVSTKF